MCKTCCVIRVILKQDEYIQMLDLYESGNRHSSGVSGLINKCLSFEVAKKLWYLSDTVLAKWESAVDTV